MFKRRQGTKGSDFDIMATLADGRVLAVEAKGRSIGKYTSKRTIINQLHDARRQLPKGEFGSIVVRVPDSWMDSDFMTTSFGQEARETLRNTGRIVSIVVTGYAQVPPYGDRAPGLMWYREILNQKVAETEGKQIRLLPEGYFFLPKSWNYLTEMFGFSNFHASSFAELQKRWAEAPPRNPF